MRLPISIFMLLLLTSASPSLAQDGYTKTFESFLLDMESTIRSLTSDGNSMRIEVKIEDAKLSLSDDETHYEGTGTITHELYEFDLPPDCQRIRNILESGEMRLRVEVDEYFDAPPDVRVYVGLTQESFPREGAEIECVTPQGPVRTTFDPQPIWGSGFVSDRHLEGRQFVDGKGILLDDMIVEGWKITGLEEADFRVYNELNYEYTDPDDGTRWWEVTTFELQPCLKYEIDFEMGRDSYTFGNEAVHVWPESYWSQFNYSLEEEVFNRLAGNPQPPRFPDWYTFVRAFGEDQVYHSTFPRVYNPRALVRWRHWSSEAWGGSCYGFAYSSLLHYCGFRNEVQRPLGGLAPDDAVREEINAKFLYQFSREGVMADMRNRDTKPKDLVRKLIDLFEDDGQRNPGLAIVLPGYGHEVVPLEIHRCIEKDSDEIISKIFVWDNNNPAAPGSFTVNETKNTITAGSEYDGGFYPDASANEFSALYPGLRKQGGAVFPQLATGEWTEVYHSGAGSAQLSVAGRPAVDLNAIDIGSAADMFPMHGKTGNLPFVPGYYVSDALASAFAVQAEGAGGRQFLCSISGSDLLDVNFDASSGTQLGVRFAPASRGISLESDAAVANMALNLVRAEADGDFAVHFSALDFAAADSLEATLEGSGSVAVLRNPGADKRYAFELMHFSDAFSRSSMFENITIAAGETHRLVIGNTDSLGSTFIGVEVDENGDGEVDDVLVLRQYGTTGIAQPAVRSMDLHSWPAPWNPALQPLQLRYSLRRNATVRLVVYNALQQQVAELVPPQEHAAGASYHATWDGRDTHGQPVPSGTYFHVLEASDGARAIGKVALLR